jgi:hypothetical protein
LTFTDGLVDGREMANGVIAAQAEIDGNKALELTCEFIWHAQPVGTIRN